MNIFGKCFIVASPQTAFDHVLDAVEYNLSSFELFFFSFAIVIKVRKKEHVDRPFIMVCL